MNIDTISATIFGHIVFFRYILIIHLDFLIYSGPIYPPSYVFLFFSVVCKDRRKKSIRLFLCASLVPKNGLIDRLENYYLFPPRLVKDVQKGQRSKGHVTIFDRILWGLMVDFSPLFYELVGFCMTAFMAVII